MLTSPNFSSALPIPTAAVPISAIAAPTLPPVEEIIEAEEKKLASEWTPAQLAFLAKPYAFHWSAAAYFVVTATALVGAIGIAVSILLLVHSINTRRRKQRTEAVGTSYLMSRKPRPTTRIMDALRRGKISNPLPSEDGHSSNYSPKKGGLEEGKDDVIHGW